MKSLLGVLSLTLLLLSCAPKVERACGSAREVLDTYTLRKVPENFRIYGTFKYGPVKLPMLLAKFDSFYTVRVARTQNVRIERDRLCVEGKCYLLPVAPEDLIFGRVLSGREYSFCRGKLLMFRERMGVYEKLVIFEGGKLREMVIRNVRKKKSFKITFGDVREGGFFGELVFEMDGKRVKLLIEEVEI